MDQKRQQGQFYTEVNPFEYTAFREWARVADIPESRILEPFAGANSIILHLRKLELCRRFTAFDISPAHEDVGYRDTLEDFPGGFRVCITNPPWLAKNSATRRKLEFPSGPYDDLYKFALEKCLANCEYVAALVPESFIRANVFRDRLSDFVSLPTKLFCDTEHPVGLALFLPSEASGVRIWIGDAFVDSLAALEAKRPMPRSEGPEVRFNDPEGNVGLFAVDNNQRASIRFCDVEDLSDYVVKHSSRGISKLWVDGRIRIGEWNAYIEEFRQKTEDVLMTCFRGIRRDGKYRRRMDWNLARGIIQNV